MTPFDAPAADRDTASAPAGVGTQALTAVDISAYLPAADSEPTA